jgi:serpin B
MFAFALPRVADPSATHRPQHFLCFLPLPKFAHEQGISLAETLSQLGMSQVVTGAADLLGIDGRRDMLVSDVIHKAKIEVSEEGTKAAAATAAVVGAMSSAYDMPVPQVSFTADRPFVYLIKDNTTNSTLFVGRVSNASAFA